MGNHHYLDDDEDDDEGLLVDDEFRYWAVWSVLIFGVLFFVPFVAVYLWSFLQYAVPHL